MTTRKTHTATFKAQVVQQVLHEYDSPRADRKGLADYFEFYNQGRLHQSLGCRTPAEVYFDTTLQKKGRLKKGQATVLTKGFTIVLGKTTRCPSRP